jgi:hypothetical protein
MRLTLTLPTTALLLATGLLPAAEGGARPERPGQGQLFERIDQDSDGQISRAEWDAARERLQERRHERDGNQDGRVDGDERRAAIEERLAQLKTNHPELYARLDSNGDGTVSLEEAKAFRDAHGRRGQGGGHIPGSGAAPADANQSGGNAAPRAYLHRQPGA